MSNLKKNSMNRKKRSLEYNKFKKDQCEVCGSRESLSIDHIKTFGSGGTDDEWNLWTLCFNCHVKKGQYGLVKFCQENKKAEELLIEKGWRFTDFFFKWLRF
jgi:5-methylcytosine-specific restriction endonuclease McrA